MTPGTAAVCRAWTASLLLGKVTVGLARRFARRHDHRHVRRLDLGLVDHLVVEAEDLCSFSALYMLAISIFHASARFIGS